MLDRRCLQGRLYGGTALATHVVCWTGDVVTTTLSRITATLSRIALGRKALGHDHIAQPRRGAANRSSPLSAPRGPSQSHERKERQRPHPQRSPWQGMGCLWRLTRRRLRVLGV